MLTLSLCVPSQDRNDRFLRPRPALAACLWLTAPMTLLRHPGTEEPLGLAFLLTSAEWPSLSLCVCTCQMGKAASPGPKGLKSRKRVLTGSRGSLAREIIDCVSCPASFLLLPDSLCTPPLPPCPSPATRASPYAALFMLRTVWGGGSDALRSYSLFLPSVQLAARGGAGTSSPSCEERSPPSKSPRNSPARVSRNVSRLCSQRPHLY